MFLLKLSVATGDVLPLVLQVRTVEFTKCPYIVYCVGHVYYHSLFIETYTSITGYLVIGQIKITKHRRLMKWQKVMTMMSDGMAGIEIAYCVCKGSSKSFISIGDTELGGALSYIPEMVQVLYNSCASWSTETKSTMVVFAARCFRLFLSNAGTRAVCQKLT